jgi:hypothetical protein
MTFWFLKIAANVRILPCKPSDKEEKLAAASQGTDGVFYGSIS